MKKIFCSLALPLGIVGSLFAQQIEKSPQISKPESPKSVNSTLADSNDRVVPKDKGSWALFILTSGGFAGTGKGNFTLVSNGYFSGTENSLLGKNFSPQSLKSLDSLVSKLTLPEKSAQNSPISEQKSPVSFCSDCYQTTLILYRRESDGTVKNLKIDWDESTKANVSEEVLKIYENFANLLSVRKSFKSL